MQTISGSQSLGRLRRSDSNGLSYSELKLVAVSKSVVVDGRPTVRLVYCADVNDRQRGRSRIVPLEDRDGQPFAATLENAAVLRANTTRMDPVNGPAGIRAYVVNATHPSPQDSPSTTAAAPVRRGPIRGFFSNATPPASPGRGGRVHDTQRTAPNWPAHLALTADSLRPLPDGRGGWIYRVMVRAQSRQRFFDLVYVGQNPSVLAGDRIGNTDHMIATYRAVYRLRTAQFPYGHYELELL